MNRLYYGDNLDVLQRHIRGPNAHVIAELSAPLRCGRLLHRL